VQVDDRRREECRKVMVALDGEYPRALVRIGRPKDDRIADIAA
jgi:hypothetical protein